MDFLIGFAPDVNLAKSAKSVTENNYMILKKIGYCVFFFGIFL